MGLYRLPIVFARKRSRELDSFMMIVSMETIEDEAHLLSGLRLGQSTELGACILGISQYPAACFNSTFKNRAKRTDLEVREQSWSFSASLPVPLRPLSLYPGQLALPASFSFLTPEYRKIAEDDLCQSRPTFRAAIDLLSPCADLFN